MAKEWKVKCKNFEKCGHYLTYSDRAYRFSLQYGFSRPEYCEDCQKKQVELRKSLPVPYVPTEVAGNAINEGFGRLYRGDRAHHMTETEGHIDRDLYGLTPAKIGEIAQRVTDGFRVIVVIGETGSGKSTLLPTWMIDPPEESGVDADFFTKDGQILHTQPRIIAATGQAQYVGEVLMGGSVGKGRDVGYIYSGEKEADWRNALVSCTDGILINEVKKGKLGQYGYIILDEAHERSENIDRLLNLLKDRLSMFPKLKIIIASATIDAEKFQTHFGSDVAAIVEFEGKQRFDREGNPVSYERIFRDPDNALPYDEPARLGRAVGDTVVSETMDLLRAMVDGNTPKGDVLIFLQGVKPIDKAVEQLRSRVKQDDQLELLVKVMPLYRNLDQKDKEKVRKHNPDDGNIWVIVSTNIAEASVTIDSLVYEIETGVENQKQFDSETGETSLPLTIISKANAKQRWGRVGRTRNGTVFCLYTEDQFMSLFPEHPTPAVQRSSMEESLVTLKAAGAPDAGLGWLDSPKPAELERAQHALVDHGSVTAEGTLTWYGYMMQNFSYSTQLKELLIAADAMGCVVEVTSILPIIQNGGYRRILLWNHRWDAYTKFAATKKHDALMAGARDDVEFALKIIKAYTDLPWVSREAWDELSEADKRALGKEWAIENFVDYDVLKTILKERDKALAMFFDKSKENVRPIDLTLINRVRFLLKWFLPGVTIRQSDQPYRFRRIVEPQKGSAVTCEIVWPFSDLPSGDAEWLDTGSLAHEAIPVIEDVTPLVSRLFVDQLYPIGGRFTATQMEVEERGIIVKRESGVFLPEAYEEYETDETNGAGEDVPDEETEDEKQEPEVETTRTLADLPIRGNVFSVALVVPTGNTMDASADVEIVGYETFGDLPTVFVTPVPDPEPFEAFVRSFNPDDDINVEVIGLLHHPDDRNATALIVRETTTGLEMLVEPNELSFTTSARVIEEMPQGRTFTMTVDRIIEKAQRVHLTLLPQTETSMTEHLTDERGREGRATVEAWVVQILDNSVMFVIGWDWGQGAAKVVQVYEDWLPKPPSEYELWEEVLVMVFRKTNGVAHASLPNLPDKVRFFMDREDTGLSHEHGTLYFKGRMTSNLLFEFKATANDRSYHRALSELYWRSNKLLVDGFADATWYRWAKETYPVDATIQATITEVSKSGLNVMVDETNGFIPRSLVTKNERVDITKLFTVGDTMEAKVVEIRVDQKELVLRCDRTVSSLGLSVGDKVNGILTGMKDRTGLFVRLVNKVAGGAIVIPLGPGIDAFAPERYVFHGNYALSALFQEGQEVTGEVLSVDDERGIAISLKTTENDPFFRLQQGMEIRGIVKTVNPSLGIFIEVAPGVDGLLHNRSLQRLDQATLDQMVPGSQVTVSIFKMDAEKRNVNLNFVRL